MKTTQAYLFWYKSSPTARTEYLYIYAVSAKQASYFFYKEGYTRMYDYSYNPIGKETREPCEVGTIYFSYWG